MRGFLQASDGRLIVLTKTDLVTSCKIREMAPLGRIEVIFSKLDLLEKHPTIFNHTGLFVYDSCFFDSCKFELCKMVERKL